MKGKQNITQAYLAKLANVSQKTVNRALSGQGDVTPETQARIQKLAHEHGYIPNKAAQVMRSGSFNTITLLMTQHASLNFLPRQMIGGIMSGLKEHNLNLTISQFSDEELINKEFYPTLLSRLMCDGMLINYPELMPQPVQDLVKRFRLPSVWLNRKHESDCVFHDEFKAGKEAAEYLIELGHRRISFVSTIDFGKEQIHFSTLDRLKGYKVAMKNAGLEDLSFTADRYLPLDEKNMAIHKVLTEVKPTAIISSLDTLEKIIYHSALLHMRIPEDLSILGFGICPLDTCGLELTTMVQSEEELGRASIEMIVNKLQAPHLDLSPAILPIRLVEGKTSVPPKQI